MRTFEEQGLIRRRQGVGTFVVRHQQVIDAGVEVLESIESIAARMGLQVSMGLLNLEHLSADNEQADIFGKMPGTALVRLSRVINAEERPVAFLVDLLPVEVLPDAGLKEGFTGSVLDWLLKRGSPQLDHSKTEIQAVAAPSDIARALQIQRGDVLLKFTAKLYTNSGELVDHSSSYFLPGYFRFHVVRRVKGVK
jgi:GntR family transcriptional regulator